MSDVPLRDAAQALQDAITGRLDEIRAGTSDVPASEWGEGYTDALANVIAHPAAVALRAALAAADPAPAADGPVLPLALTEADAHNLGRVMTVCEGCRKGHYSLGGKVTNYPCADADCGCWFCHGPQGTPAQADAAERAAADGTTPTQPDEVLYECTTSEIDGLDRVSLIPMPVVARPPGTRVRVVATPATEDT